jgi:hypothetical protein
MVPAVIDKDNLTQAILHPLVRTFQSLGAPLHDPVHYHGLDNHCEKKVIWFTGSTKECIMQRASKANRPISNIMFVVHARKSHGKQKAESMSSWDKREPVIKASFTTMSSRANVLSVLITSTF